MKKILKLIILIGISILVIAIIFVICYEPYKVNLSTNDQKSIEKTVNHYYTSLENQKYNEALSDCLIDDNNYLHMNIQTRVLCLQELRNYIITTFIADKFDGSSIQYDRKETSYRVNVSLEMTYTNTSGGAVNEIVFLRKINNEWKIVKLDSVDRYVCYRVGKYEYERDIDFLVPNK